MVSALGWSVKVAAVRWLMLLTLDGWGAALVPVALAAVALAWFGLAAAQGWLMERYARYADGRALV